MALTTVPVSEAATTATPDKMIRAGTNSQAIIYTCPAGRKFIGQGVMSSNGSSNIYLGSGSDGSIAGSASGGFSFDLYLGGGESITAQYAGISGIESDA